MIQYLNWAEKRQERYCGEITGDMVGRAMASKCEAMVHFIRVAVAWEAIILAGCSGRSRDQTVVQWPRSEASGELSRWKIFALCLTGGLEPMKLWGNENAAVVRGNAAYPQHPTTAMWQFPTKSA
jgi:hypothetical protein